MYLPALHKHMHTLNKWNVAYGEPASSGSCSKGMLNSWLACWTHTKPSTAQNRYTREPVFAWKYPCYMIWSFNFCPGWHITHAQPRREKTAPRTPLRKKNIVFSHVGISRQNCTTWKCWLYFFVFAILCASSFFISVQDWTENAGKPLCQRTPQSERKTHEWNCLLCGWFDKLMYHLWQLHQEISLRYITGWSHTVSASFQTMTDSHCKSKYNV